MSEIPELIYINFYSDISDEDLDLKIKEFIEDEGDNLYVSTKETLSDISTPYILKSKYDESLKRIEELEKENEGLKDKSVFEGHVKSITISSEQLESWSERDKAKWHDLVTKPTHMMIIDSEGEKTMIPLPKPPTSEQKLKN